MEGGPQREGPVHVYPFKHGQKQRDLTLGTAAQERLSAESNILLQNLQQGGEGRTGLSKQKGEAVYWCCRGAAKLKQTPPTKSSHGILGTNTTLHPTQRLLLASHSLCLSWSRFKKNLAEEV